MSFGIPVRNGLAIGLLSSTTLSSNGGLFPAMALDFLQPFLDSRITFSRGSNATLVDSTGKITYAPANLVPYSQEFDNAAWTKTAATITANATSAPDGTTTAGLMVPNTTLSQHRIDRATTITATAHTWSCFAKAGGYGFAWLRIGLAGAVFNLSTGATSNVSAGVTATAQAFADGWWRLSVSATAAGNDIVRINALPTAVASDFSGDGTSGIYLWGAQLEPVTYQTVPGTYNATTASAYYGPRFDYDPVTLAPKGLLIEEQRTNLLLRSQLIGGTSWVSSDVTCTTNSILAPDGTTTASLVTESSTTAAHAVYGTNATFTVTAHTISVFIKAGTRRYVSIRGETTGISTYAWITFDTTTGAINANAAVTSSSATAFGNGWWRVTMTWANIQNGLGVANIVFAGSDVSTAPATSSVLGNSYLGNGSTFYLWGAQVEAGSFATSYIPTVASQVTRSADVATMTGTNFSSWYNQSEGTFVADASPTNNGCYTLAATDGTANEEIVLRYASTGTAAVIRDGGAIQANFGTGVLTGKNALAYKVNDFAVSTNGGAAATDTSGTVPTNNQVSLGRAFDGTLNINGHIRQIAYYNTRLPNATLQALTAPSLVTTLSMSFTNQAYTVGV
jgi:hypothetical protein